MIKKTVTYKDWDENEVTEDLYFNLTRTDLADNLELKAEFEKLHAMFSGEERELNTNEVQMMVDMIKKFMEISYGKRTGENGKRFVKSKEVFEDFRWSPAWDALLWSLFENPDEAMQFMLGIIPTELRLEAEAQVKAEERKAKVAKK